MLEQGKSVRRKEQQRQRLRGGAIEQLGGHLEASQVEAASVQGRRAAGLCGQGSVEEQGFSLSPGQLLHSLSGSGEAFDPAACLNSGVYVLLSISKKQAYIISVNGFNFRLKVTAKQGRIKEGPYHGSSHSVYVCIAMSAMADDAQSSALGQVEAVMLPCRRSNSEVEKGQLMAVMKFCATVQCDLALRDLSQAKQPQFPQLLLIRLLLQTLHQLRCPSLDTLQHLNISLVGWRLNHFPGQPVPMLDNPFREEKFPNIQSKPPLAQLEATSSCPITCYLGEKTDPQLSTTSFQAKQFQLPQPLLIRLLLQTLHQLRCPSLDTLQHLNIPLVVGGPKLNTVFQVRPHQCRVQGHNHSPSPAGHAIFDTSQDAIGFLGHLGTLLAHIQVAVNQHPQVLLCQAAFQPLFPKPVALHGVAVAQVQDLAFGLVEPHTIDLGPPIQPVQVPLQSLRTLQQINTPTQLGVVYKLIESTLDPFVQIIDKDVKQNWPQHRALGNTACDGSPTGVNSIHHHSLGPAVQPVLYPAKSTPVQAMSSQFLQENAVGNRVKGFTEV
ncbi:hypothetical protein QYF61_008343 [Mycteria americana]|uniref:Uncharacterized protein n=1 Tax=Mycteria americana TaxID=33587 RepID=A0AAN7NX91_MYCAM|nr:hypothetical protein QYF61_008343 [Mycteria americana]